MSRTLKPSVTIPAPSATRLYAHPTGLETAANSQRSSAPKMSIGGPKYGFSGSLANSTLSGRASSTVPRKSMLMMAAAAEVSPIPDMAKRTLMNYILLGSTAATIATLGGPFLFYFYPAGAGGGGGGVAAKDRNGDDVTLAAWKAAHKPGDYELVQGLKGDATYLVSTDGGIKDFGINAVCTHLGCVVPWNKAENKFMCPCHGSQYNADGKVVRGPAPLSLALAHVATTDAGIVSFTP